MQALLRATVNIEDESLRRIRLRRQENAVGEGQKRRVLTAFLEDNLSDVQLLSNL